MTSDWGRVPVGSPARRPAYPMDGLVALSDMLYPMDRLPMWSCAVLPIQRLIVSEGAYVPSW